MNARPAMLGLLTVLGAMLGLASGCTSSNPDFPTSCSLGDRQCASPPRTPDVALVCGRDASDALGFIEEPCPATALCDSGHCTPGANAASCRSQSDCGMGLVCVPLVSSASGTPALASYCVPAASAQAAVGATCSTDSDCASYRCLQHAQGRFCLQACATGKDCAASAACRTFMVTVNGVQGSILSCSPQ